MNMHLSLAHFTLFSAALVLMLTTGCGNIRLNKVDAPAQVSAPTSVDHTTFDAILESYVDESGMVDYSGLKERRVLTPYLEMLAGISPENLPADAQLAFWINVYNANTLKLIVDNYPTKSITDLVPFAPFGLKVFVPKANSPFDQTFIRTAGREMSLNDIEHGIIRKEFDDPRIHFALVCAAVSCPLLRREAFVGSRLDAQLQDQGRIFLRDTRKNQIPSAPGEARLSKILDWYGGDFGPNRTALQQALAPYFDGEIRQTLERGGYKLSFNTYDWALNDQSTAN